MISEKAFLYRVLAIAGVLLLLFVAGLVLPTTTSAALDACRADPILYLSNGKVMVVDIAIGTDVSRVKSVQYVVNVPRGVTLVKVVWLGDPALIAKEQLDFRADRTDGLFQSDTVVQTTVNKIPVTVTTKVDSYSETVTGVSAQHLKFKYTIP